MSTLVKRSFIAELQRRNVHRAAVFYAGVAWLLVQIATQVFPFFHIPEWVVRWVVIAAAIGFPFAMLFSWFYEWTPQGIRRESEIVHTESVTRQTGKKLDKAIIAVLTLAVLVLLLNQFVLHHFISAAAVAEDGHEKSIAVLPLANESGDKDQQYFSDGLSEDLINALSQSSGLKVIARGSSFRFRDSQDDVRTIGAKLGAAHLLEGSVRRAGDMVRISAELVDVADGSTLWSQHFDRPYADLFKLEDDITAAVVGALSTRLAGSKPTADQSERPPGGSLEAYNAYQQGKFYLERFTDEDTPRAISWFEKAVQLDPQYARAYNELAYGWFVSAGDYLEGAQAAEAVTKGRAALDRALQLQPDLAAAHAQHANLLAIEDFDWNGAEAEARRAVQLAPNDAAARRSLGIVLGATGRFDESVQNLLLARDADPLETVTYLWLQGFQLAQGRDAEAEQTVRKGIELQPSNGLLRYDLTLQQLVNGDRAGARATAEQTPPGSWRITNMALAGQAGDDRAAADAALQKMIDTQAGFAAFQIAEIYALRQQPDQMFQWLDRARDNRDPGLRFLLGDPVFKSHHSDRRFAALCRQLGLPEPTTGAGHT
jgi:serine/threonine-protein kinase